MGENLRPALPGVIGKTYIPKFYGNGPGQFADMPAALGDIFFRHFQIIAHPLRVLGTLLQPGQTGGHLPDKTGKARYGAEIQHEITDRHIPLGCRVDQIGVSPQIPDKIQGSSQQTVFPYPHRPAALQLLFRPHHAVHPLPEPLSHSKNPYILCRQNISHGRFHVIVMLPCDGLLLP